jgi:hypothetical protein
MTRRDGHIKQIFFLTQSLLIWVPAFAGMSGGRVGISDSCNNYPRRALKNARSISALSSASTPPSTAGRQ